MCKRYIFVGKGEEAQLIIDKIVTEKISDSESTSLSELLRLATNDLDKGSLKMFVAVILFASTSPGWWPVVEGEIETAIKNAREGKQELLPILLLNLGILAYHFRAQGSREGLRTAVGHWCECLATLHQNFNETSTDRARLQLVERQAVGYLSLAYSEQQEDVPFGVFKSDWISSDTKYVVASHYTSCGQRSEARNLLRPEMVEAFNILCDNDISNDDWGFFKLSHILNQTGDFDNAREAHLLAPRLKFDGEVLQALLASKDGGLDEASQNILDFYQNHCLDSDGPQQNLRKVSGNVKRLLGATDGNCGNVSPYKAILDTLGYLDHMGNESSICDNCNAEWDYETSLHTCKMCYNLDLCDACLDKFRSTETTVLVCNKSHDWWDRGGWTMERYIQGCKKLVPLASEDGSIELVSMSKWLGCLCEEWGLSKVDWDFE
jgi:hypothetical protein